MCERYAIFSGEIRKSSLVNSASKSTSRRQSAFINHQSSITTRRDQHWYRATSQVQDFQVFGEYCFRECQAGGWTISQNGKSECCVWKLEGETVEQSTCVYPCEMQSVQSDSTGYSIVWCWNLDCLQSAGEGPPRVHDKTPSSHNEYLMERQDNQHRSVETSWCTINGGHANTDEPELARTCWEDGPPASPSAVTLLTVMRGQTQSG